MMTRGLTSVPRQDIGIEANDPRLTFFDTLTIFKNHHMWQKKSHALRKFSQKLRFYA